jgi:hypothetical protein
MLFELFNGILFSAVCSCVQKMAVFTIIKEYEHVAIIEQIMNDVQNLQRNVYKQLAEVYSYYSKAVLMNGSCN